MIRGSSVILHPRSWNAGTRLPVLAVSAVAAVVFSILYFGFPVFIIPFAFMVVAVVVMTLRSPTLGMCLVIAFQYLPLQAGSVTYLQIVGVAVACLCLFWFAIHQRGLVFPSILAPCVTMALLILYSASYGRDPGGSVFGARKMLFNVLFCLLLVNVVDNYRRLAFPLWTMVGVALLNSLAAGVQFAFRTTADFRSRGFLENENELGEVAAAGFVITLYYFLQETHRWKRLGYLSLCGLLSIGIVTSISRGAIIALVMALLYILFREKRYRKHFLVLGALVLAGIPFLPDFFLHRFSNIGQEVKGTVFLNQRTGLSTRGYFNKAAIKIWKAHPFMGVGFGSFGYYFIQPEFNPGVRTTRSLPPHNVYLEALVELGVVGFAVLGWWILQSALNFWTAERKTEGFRNIQYLRTCEAVTFLLLVACFSGGSIVDTRLAMMLALGAVCRRCSQNPVSEVPLPVA